MIFFRVSSTGECRREAFPQILNLLPQSKDQQLLDCSDLEMQLTMRSYFTTWCVYIIIFQLTLAIANIISQSSTSTEYTYKSGWILPTVKEFFPPKQKILDEPPFFYVYRCTVQCMCTVVWLYVYRWYGDILVWYKWYSDILVCVQVPPPPFPPTPYPYNKAVLYYLYMCGYGETSVNCELDHLQ